MGVCLCRSSRTSQILRKRSTIDPIIDPEATPGVLSVRVRGLITPLASHALAKTEECIGSEQLPASKGPEDWALLTAALSGHSLFAGLSEDVHKVLIEEMKAVRLLPGGEVFNQDQHGCNFYIIKLGTALIQVDGQDVRELGPAQAFGELALLQNTRRTATVKAKTQLDLWVLEQSVFATAVRASSALHYRETKDFINRVELLDGLSFKQKDALLDVVVPLKFAPGEKIAGEGEPGHMMFIVSEGEVALLQKTVAVRKVAKGQIFGEQAIYHLGYKHEHTAVAETAVTLLTLDRTNALFALGPQMETILMRRIIELSFARNRTLKKLPSEVRERLYASMTVQHYTSQSIVFPRGLFLGSTLYVILEGTLRTNSGLFAQAGDCIGEEEVAMENPTTRIIEDVMAGEDMFIAEIVKEKWVAATAVRTLNDPDSEPVLCLRKVTVFRTVKTTKLLAMANVSSIQVLRPETVVADADIVKQGEAGSALFLIRSGTVEVIRNGVSIKTMGKFDYFGERSLILNEPRSTTVRAKTSVSLYVLEQDDLNRVVDERMRTNVVQSTRMEQLSLSLQDLYVMSMLERNQYGETYLVQHAQTDMRFIGVTYDKGKLGKAGKLQGMKETLGLFQGMDYPLITKHYKTIKTDSHLFLIREFVPGTSLDRLIYDHGKLNEALVRFYTGNILLAFEYLHDRSILYRNLASEYVVIDETGYPRLCVFEHTKRVEGRTNSVVGVTHFMAPEVILGQYYGIGADLWSLGVLVFEMTQGKVPFGANAQTPYEVYEDILRHKKMKVQGTQALAGIIDTLLVSNPAARAKGGLEILRRMEWFQGFPWEEVMTQEAIPPLLPRVRQFPKEFSKTLARKELLTAVCPASEAALTLEQERLWTAIEPSS